MAGGMQGGYPSPAPMRRQGNNGLLLWSLIGCGVIALLAVIIIGFSMKGVLKKSGVNALGQLEPVADSVQKIDTSLEAYKKDHNGQYPSSLDALVPKYVTDKSKFVCGDSDSPKPMEYAMPKSGDSDGFVVVRVHIGDISVVPTQVQKMYVCLQKDGQIVSEQSVRTVLSKHGRDSDEHQRPY